MVGRPAEHLEGEERSSEPPVALRRKGPRDVERSAPPWANWEARGATTQNAPASRRGSHPSSPKTTDMPHAQPIEL